MKEHELIEEDSLIFRMIERVNHLEGMMKVLLSVGFFNLIGTMGLIISLVI